VSFEPILLAPEEEIEEVYPYRRVWRTSWQEITALTLIVAVLWVLSGLFEVLPNTSAALPRVSIALLPFGLFLWYSYRAELRVPQPRRYLLSLVILGALAANGVAVPLEERLYEPDRWLPLVGFFARVLGYAFTVGFTAAFLHYLVMRFSIWPDRIRQRQDGVAYGLTIGLGFALVYNIRAALLPDVTLLATALRVTSYTFSYLAMGALIGFFMAELIMGRVPIFWLPFGLFFTALVSGFYYAFRAVAILGGLSLDGTGSSPIRGLPLAFGLVAVVFLITAFIIQNADTRAAHASGRREAL
jgi:hypothetical protein